MARVTPQPLDVVAATNLSRRRVLDGGDMSQYRFTNMDLFHEKANDRWDLNEASHKSKDDALDAFFARHSPEHVRRDRVVIACRRKDDT